MGAPALPPLGIALRLAEDFNGMLVDHCCPLRHRFSQCIDFFGVQDLARTLEELSDAGPMQFQLGPADPERTKG